MIHPTLKKIKNLQKVFNSLNISGEELFHLFEKGGWDRQNVFGCLTNKYILISPCKKIIFKKNGLCKIGDARKMDSKCYLPTFIVKEKWFLQPKCSRINEKNLETKMLKKMMKLCKWKGNEEEFLNSEYAFCDIHDENIGFWNGEYYLFDW